MDNDLNRVPVKGQGTKEHVGPVKPGEEMMVNGGKMIFVSSSHPFEGADGKRYRRVAQMNNTKRQYKREIMKKLGFNSGKQFRVWEHKQRMIEAAVAGDGRAA
jgi:hypothetical protein